MSDEIKRGGTVERFHSEREGEHFAAFSCAIEFVAVCGVHDAMWEQFAFLSTVDGRVLVVVRPDGSVRLAEDATVDEAALAFWQAVAACGAGIEQRRRDDRAARLRALPRYEEGAPGQTLERNDNIGEWLRLEDVLAAASE